MIHVTRTCNNCNAITITGVNECGADLSDACWPNLCITVSPTTVSKEGKIDPFNSMHSSRENTWIKGNYGERQAYFPCKKGSNNFSFRLTKNDVIGTYFAWLNSTIVVGTHKKIIVYFLVHIAIKALFFSL